MAKIIGEAGIRLRADSRGLASEMRAILTKAAKEATAGLRLELGKTVEDDANRTASRVKSIFADVGRHTRSIVQGFNQATGAAMKLALQGAAIGVALAAASSATTGIIGLAGALAQAAGAAGLIPAALLAIKSITATLQIGFQGVGDSLSSLMSGDMQKFAESVKGLSPEAQKVVGQLGKFHGAIEALKASVQDNIFRGLQAPVNQLVTQNLPKLRSLFDGIAVSANGAFKETLAFLNSGQAQASITTLFGNLRQTATQLAPALRPAVSAFLDLSTVGSSFLPQLSAGLTSVATRFGNFIAQSAQSGALANFFQKALDTIEQLFGVLGNLGSIIGSVFRAADAAGGGFLNTLLQVTDQLATFLKSASGQSALTSFFSSMREIIGALLPVLLSVVQVVANNLVPIFSMLARTLLPVINVVVQQFGAALTAAMPGITALVQGLATLLEVFGPTITFAVQLAGILGGVLGKVLQTLAPVLARVANALLNGLIKIMPQLEPVIIAVADAVVQLIDAAIPLIPIFLQLITALLPILPPLIQLVAAILPPLIGLVQALVPVIQAFAQILIALIPPITAVVTTILNILIPPIQLIATIVAQVALIVADVFTALSGTITTILTTLGTIISGIWGTIVNIFTGAVQLVGSIVRGAFEGIRSFIATVLSGIGSAVRSGLDTVVGFFRDLPGKVLSFLGNLASDAVEAGANIIRGIIRGLGNLAGAIVDKIKQVVSNAWDAVLDFFGIGSPSKLAEETFTWVGKGAIKGLEGISSSVQDAAAQMARDAMAAMAAPLGAGASIGAVTGSAALTGGTAGGLGGGVLLQQTNIMQPGADVLQFAAEVSRRGAQQLASGSSVLPVSVGSVQAGMASPDSMFGVGGL